MARHFGFAQETTWGTEVTPDHFVEAVNESVQVENAFESVEVLTKISPVDLVPLTTLVRGDVEIVAMYDGLALLAKHLVGNVTSATSGSVYVHTIPQAAGPPATDRTGLGLTLEVNRDEMSWRYLGCKIVSWSHAFGIDAASRITVGFLGKSESGNGPVSSPTFPAVKPMFPSHVTVSFDGGTTAHAARNCTIEVDNPVDEANILGVVGLGRQPVRSGVQRVTVSAEVLFENKTDFYNTFAALGVVDMRVRAHNGLSGADERSCTYNLNKCRITQATPHLSGRDRLVASVEAESYHDATATQNLQLIMVNDALAP